MVILGLVFLLFLFFFGIMFLMALGSQNLREEMEKDRAAAREENESKTGNE